MRADGWPGAARCGNRACRPLDGAAPAAVFAAVEQRALAPLPAAPFVLATWSSAKIGPDIHAKVGATLYSLPWRYLGERVDARSTTTMVQFFPRERSRPSVQNAASSRLRRLPPIEFAFRLRTPTWCGRRPPMSPGMWACSATLARRAVPARGQGVLVGGTTALRPGSRPVREGPLRPENRLPHHQGASPPSPSDRATARRARRPRTCTAPHQLFAIPHRHPRHRPSPAPPSPAPPSRHRHPGTAIPGTAIPGTAIVPDLLANVIPLPTARGADPTDPTTTTPAPGTATGPTRSEALS